MNIYIVVEVKKREFVPKFLLSLEAALNNHTVYVGNITQLLIKDILKPGLLHHKSITPTVGRQALLKKLKKKKFIVSSLDEEVGGVSVDAKEYVNIRYGNKTVKLADQIFTWGKFDHQNLSRTYKKYKNKILNTGNPRVDLWRNDFQKFHGKRKKKIILYSSNYNFFFGNLSLIDQYRKKKSLGYFKRGEREKFWLYRVKKEAIILEKLITTLKNLSKKFSKKHFVFRPHPDENADNWRTIFEDCKNIEVNNHHNLSEVMNDAELVLHNGCTGGLESAIRQIPTICYVPVKDVSSGHPIANKVSDLATNEKQLIKKIENIFKNNRKHSFNKIVKKEILFRYENLNNTLPAYKKITKSWYKYDSPELSEDNSDYTFKKFFLKKKLKKGLSMRPFKNPKFSPFLNKDIIRIKEKLSKINDKFKNVSVKIIGDDLIKVHLKN